MPTRRKALIAIGGSIALAGCSDSEPEPEPDESESGPSIDSDSNLNEEYRSQEEEDEEQNIEDQIEEELEDADPVEEPPSETQTILNQAGRRVDGGEYLYWPFELYQSVELHLRTTVRQGSEVDVIITSPDELGQFERGNRYRFYDDISQENTTGDDTSQRIGAGNYIVMINNRTRQSASVDIELTARA